MTIQTSLGRRGFIASATAGGFSLGFSFPWASAQAAEVQELNAWVVIHPDDKVVIRIARSEMGQGTLTGLAQLVAEELECDWSKITTEYPTPGENVKRNRVWKNFSTGGSRGIRESNQYVREGGAMAREMLIAAAATQWGVPAAECKAANSKVTHSSGKSATFGHRPCGRMTAHRDASVTKTMMIVRMRRFFFIVAAANGRTVNGMAVAKTAVRSPFTAHSFIWSPNLRARVGGSQWPTAKSRPW